VEGKACGGRLLVVGATTDLVAGGTVGLHRREGELGVLDPLPRWADLVPPRPDLGVLIAPRLCVARTIHPLIPNTRKGDILLLYNDVFQSFCIMKLFNQFFFCIQILISCNHKLYRSFIYLYVLLFLFLIPLILVNFNLFFVSLIIISLVLVIFISSFGPFILFYSIFNFQSYFLILSLLISYFFLLVSVIIFQILIHVLLCVFLLAHNLYFSLI
jgi:hypothetical protein